MKIGFPNHPRKDIADEIKWIGENDFDFVDLFLEENMAVPEKIDINEVKELLNKYDLGVVGHTAWYWPIGSPVAALRDATVKESAKYMKTFGKIGVKLVTIHTFWPPSIFSAEEGIKWQIETLEKIMKEAEKFNVEIMLEPADQKHDSIENISAIMEKMPDLHLHLDLGHANLHGRNIIYYIETFHEKIHHVHVHDNDGTSDQHKALGNGTINWEKIIPVLKKYYDGTITLEIFESDKNLVLESRKKLKELWMRS